LKISIEGWLHPAITIFNKIFNLKSSIFNLTLL